MTLQILVGDVRHCLQSLPADSVHCAVTSPPYWGLRSYLPDEHPDKAAELGLEATPTEYIDKMVAVFAELRRVLRPDGTLWLNIGDSYASKAGGYDGTGSAGRSDAGISRKTQSAVLKGRQRIPPPGLKRKDLIGIPWMLAFALRADGWWLRSEIIWHKPNPLPESVRDRPTKSHEQIFLLTKSPDYFYDHVAIQETALYGDHPRNGNPDMVVQSPSQPKQAGITKVRSQGNKNEQRGDPRKHGFNERWRDQQGNGWGRSGGAGFHERWDPAEDAGSLPGTRNKRSVWTIPTYPYPEAHFATFPPALVEPCILAGTSSGGCCPACGAPYNRIVEVHYDNPGNRSQRPRGRSSSATRRPGSRCGWRRPRRPWLGTDLRLRGWTHRPLHGDRPLQRRRHHGPGRRARRPPLHRLRALRQVRADGGRADRGRRTAPEPGEASMIVGGYTLHLYCRHASTSGFDPRHYTVVGEFPGRNRRDCMRDARKAGWRFDKDEDVTCPVCVTHGPGSNLDHIA